MILLIDNYDSFSYNLFQLVGAINDDIKIIRNDEMTVDEIKELAPSPVSYTHLDVYKRQVPAHLKRHGIRGSKSL